MICQCQYCRMGESEGSLTPLELRALTAFKWRYAIEAAGFSEKEARTILFHRWLFRREKVRT